MVSAEADIRCPSS